MKNRPILFSTPMVQAIMGGNKTQTRRVVKPQLDEPFAQSDWHIVDYDNGTTVICPYGQIGDVLWVRETWYNDAIFGAPIYVYRANGEFSEQFHRYETDARLRSECKWKPSIHMPKEACRIFLRITNVRVERLKDISENDAIAEGVEKVNPERYHRWKDYSTGKGFYECAVLSFKSLWQSINGPESWDKNPWVWVIEFEQIQKPESWPN